MGNLKRWASGIMGGRLVWDGGICGCSASGKGGA